MSTVADKLAKKSSSKSSAKQVRLRLVYIDFWSALKLSFLAAVAIAIVTVVAFFLIYTVISTTGVITQVGDLVKTISPEIDLVKIVALPQVMAFSAVVAILNLVVVTVLGAVVAVPVAASGMIIIRKVVVPAQDKR